MKTLRASGSPVFIFLYFWSFVSSQDAGVLTPPQITIGDGVTVSELTIEAGKDLRLTCNGDFVKLEWETPDRVGDAAEENRLTIADTTLDSGKHRSVLTVTAMTAGDVGYYMCRHEVSGSKSEDKVYVFVNDPVKLIVPVTTDPFSPISVLSNQITEIPCFPSAPDVNVTFGKPSESPRKIDFGFQFDNKIGFRIVLPSVKDQGLWVCKGRRGVVEDEQKYFLLYQESTDPPEPTINVTSERQLSGTTFNLTCIVFDSSNDVSIILTWSYPNEGETSGRITEGEFKQGMINKDGYMYRKKFKTLFVNNAKTSDSGVYKCTASSASNVKKETSRSIEVYGSAFANLEPRYRNIEVELNSPQAILIVKINAHPTPEIRWYKNNQEIQVSRRYEMKKTDLRARLHIYEVKQEDTGDYTAKAFINGKVVSQATVTLAVIVAPAGRIWTKHTANDQEAEFQTFQVNTEYKIGCIVEGYPQPRISWFWADCDSHDCAQVQSEKYMAVNSTSNFVMLDDSAINTPNNHLSVLHLQGVESGWIKCTAVNKNGSVELLQRFLVSDVARGFALTSSPKDPIVDDEFYVSCKASRWLYDAPTVLYSTVKDPQEAKILQGAILVNSTAERNITTIKTNYSNEVLVSIPSITVKDSGVYSCVAMHKNSSKLEIHVPVQVRAIEKPKFTDYIGGIHNEDPGKSVKLVCRATGVPPPVITWYKKGVALSNKDGVRFDEMNTTVTILKVNSKDEGMYSCIAQNRGGSIQANVTLNVNGEDLIAVPEAVTKGGLTPAQIGIIAGIAGAVVVVIILAVVCLKMRRQKKPEERFLLDYLQYTPRHDLNPDIPIDEQTDCIPYDPKYEFPKDRLKLGMVIGQGAFGRVCKAEALGIQGHSGTLTVAVKMVKDCFDTGQIKALISEMKILIHIGQHLNIVNCLGAVTKDLPRGELYVIIDYCGNGNLRQFLIQNRANFKDTLTKFTRPPSGYLEPMAVGMSLPGIDSAGESAGATGGTSDGAVGNDYMNWRKRDRQEDSDSSIKKEKEPPLTTKDLICFAFQIARGLEYLASKQYIHRDLAARNVLLSEDRVCKICDFGMAKDIYKYHGEYQKKTAGPLPIKWLALESLVDKIFTTKSDIWSYGVLLWEIFTMGSSPYPGLEMNETFIEKLEDGYRMQKPPRASDEIYEWMLDCWHPEADERPTAAELANKFGDLLQENAKDAKIGDGEDHHSNNHHGDDQYYLDFSEKYGEASSAYLNMDKDGGSGGEGYLNMGPAPPTPNVNTENEEIDLDEVSIHSDKAGYYGDKVRWKKNKDEPEAEPLTKVSSVNEKQGKGKSSPKKSKAQPNDYHKDLRVDLNGRQVKTSIAQPNSENTALLNGHHDDHDDHHDDAREEDPLMVLESMDTQPEDYVTIFKKKNNNATGLSPSQSMNSNATSGFLSDYHADTSADNSIPKNDRNESSA